VADGFDRIQELGDFCRRFTDSDKNSLIAAVAGHPSVTWERPNTSTVSGGQTANLVNDQDAAIGQFVTALTAEVDSIVRAMPENPNCLFTRRIPRAWRYSIWATIIGEAGHQTPHLHPGGWLSGVYYAEVPETIRDDADDDKQGWIEFGAPGYNY